MGATSKVYPSAGARITSLVPRLALAPGLFEAELNYLIQYEWARCADDVLWRRTKLGLHLEPAGRAQVAAWFDRQRAERPSQPAVETPCN